MSFSTTSTNVRLEDGHILVATCTDADGNSHESKLDLDDFIGNDNGWFAWDRENFSHSAKDVRLRDGYFLIAELPKRDGGYRETQGIDLNQRISNDNGKLVFGKSFTA
ncbi:hypothetical protein BGX21_010660 [Mortierella sp. AD011]|nr:hypothetical protein BGX20_009434 [Mortierella sp. AD010]KAF9393697.1 hypothetical protein BGX21_010660 [Mortierella sp. AD011]